MSGERGGASGAAAMDLDATLLWRRADVQALARSQAELVDAIWQPLLQPKWALPAQVAAHWRDQERGLRAYHDHARAASVRVLAAAYPVVQQILGDEAFAALAQNFWWDCPPEQGDLALWGQKLGVYVQTGRLAEHWRDEAYLGDLARLEWAIHVCERSADAPMRLQTLEWLGQYEPHALRLCLMPGAQLLWSDWPVASVWGAHVQASPDWDRLRQALHEGQREMVLIWRRDWQAQLRVLDLAEATWLRAVLGASSLDQALDAVVAFQSDWDFGAWLREAVDSGLFQTLEKLEKP